MVKENYDLGGEQSGHIIFKRHATTGDGILTSLKLMDVMINEKKSIKELADDVKLFPQVLKNIEVNDKNKCINDNMLLETIKKEEIKLSKNGRILVRKSGTENIIRIMVEAKNIDICKECVDVIYRKIIELGYGI